MDSWEDGWTRMTLDVCWHVSLRHTSCGSSPRPTLLSCLADVLQKKISSRSLIWKCAAIPDESNRKTTGVSKKYHVNLWWRFGLHVVCSIFLLSVSGAFFRCCAGCEVWVCQYCPVLPLYSLSCSVRLFHNSSATTLHMFVLRLPILLHEFGDNRQTLIKETSRVVIQKHCSATGYRISRSSSIF